MGKEMSTTDCKTDLANPKIMNFSMMSIYTVWKCWKKQFMRLCCNYFGSSWKCLIWLVMYLWKLFVFCFCAQQPVVVLLTLVKMAVYVNQLGLHSLPVCVIFPILVQLVDRVSLLHTQILSYRLHRFHSTGYYRLQYLLGDYATTACTVVPVSMVRVVAKYPHRIVQLVVSKAPT